MRNFIELLYVQKETYCVNVNHDRRSKDAYSMVVEIWAKTEEGIRYSFQRCELIENPASKIKEWLDKTRRFGLASHRPYTPGQACDGTISACVTALFIDLCKQRNINPVTVWNAAYPEKKEGVKKKELELTKEFADWQSVAYPKQWDSIQIELMIESLHNANFHQLATVVSEELGL